MRKLKSGKPQYLLYVKLLYRILEAPLDDEKLIPTQPFAFRACYSMIEMTLEGKKICIFLDIEWVFNKVRHKGLEQKLCSCFPNTVYF